MNSNYLALLALCLTISVSSIAQCDADAGANVTICAGQSVTLGGNPSAVNPANAAAVTYDWNGSVADVANPSVSPTSTTTYTLTLSGSDCAGETDQITVTVLPSPNANFTAAPLNQCANIPVSFTNTSTGCTNCQYSWNFGDPASGTNNTSTLASPSHTFSATGNGTETYTVTLTVTNGSNQCSDSHTISVTVNEIPNISLQDPITSFAQCSGDPTFNLSVFDATVPATNSNYSINWGDGSPSWTGTTAPIGLSHLYTQNDVFDLVYTVTGTNGCSATETIFVSNITNPSIGAANPGGTSGCGPLQICFPLNNYQANHSSTTYTVDFGDGSPTQLLNHPPPTEICHTYTGSSCTSTGGAYTFTIIANNTCDVSVATITPVRVYTGPTAAFTATPVPACVNSNITFFNTSILGFNNQCSSTTVFTWNWGDGSPNTTALTNTNQSHAYAAAGNYTVTLTAQNSCGTSTASQIICVETPPTPQFTVNTNLGCVPLAVNTTNTSNNGIPCAVNYAWLVDYVDAPCDPDNGAFTYTGGTSSSSLQPSFNLQSVGTYTIRLQMTNACGVFQDQETIVVNTVPVVGITTPTSVCAGTTASFTGIVDPCNLTISSYAWTFGSGSPATSTSLNPGAISYPTAGNYPVTFTATNACGPSTANATINVLPIPVVNITTNQTGNAVCTGSPIVLSASGAGSFTWSPSTFLSSTFGSSVTASPTSTITYTVTGNSGSCSDTETITVTVNPLPVVAPSGTFSMCVGETEILGVNVTGGLAPYSSYAWSNAGTLTGANTANPTSSATTSTNYTVSVTDSRGCVGTGTVPLTVNPLPVVNAGPDISLCNQPVPTALTGFSPTTGGSGVWSGTNVTSAGVFTPSGVGNTTLTYCFTSSTTGCQACDNMVVTVVNPIPANAGPDTTACLNGSTLFLPTGGTWSGSSQVTASGAFNGTVVGPVTLTFSVGSGSCLATDQVVVTVLAPPTVNAGADVTICAGSSSVLTASATSANGAIQNYVWSGGPLNPQMGTTTTVTPLSTTIYNVTVVDASGCDAEDQVTVIVNPLPVVGAGADINLCNQPIATQLTGTTPATGGVWSGPNVTSTGLFTPSGTGNFTLTYSFTNPTTQCVNSDQMVVTVVNAVVANAGPDLSICESNVSYQVVPAVSGGTWTPAPISSTGSFIPNTPGNYVFTYSIGSGTCLTQDQVTVTVNALPVASAGSDVIICVGDTTVLNGTASNGQGPYDFLWNFGASLSSATVGNPNAFPTSTTNYTLTVEDQNGCVDTDQVVITVNTLPVVNAGSDLVLCDQPITEVLTGFSPITGGTGVWSGPGITNPSGSFISPGIGTYTLYYEFTAGGNNCSNTDSIQVVVNAPIIAQAGPNASLCLNEPPYSLPGITPSTGGTWSGSVGLTSATSGVFNPQVAGVGTYTLQLSFGSGTCLTTDQVQITVLPLPTVNAGTDQVLCGNAAPFTMTGYTPATGGIWEGTGITNSATGGFDPAIGAGSYPVLLRYTDPITGCSDTSFKNVVISPVPVANFTLAPLGCTNAPVDIVNTTTGASAYQWNYGNGTTLNGFDPVYTYPLPGIYDVQLIASNAFGCQDTASNSHEVINPPVSVLTLLPNEGCAPLTVNFDNESVGQYLSFAWNLSISTSTDSIPTAQVYNQGPDVLEYPISLTVTNFCGTDVDTDEVVVYPQPVAGFGTDLDVFCSPFTVQINNISTGNPDVFTWDFGDGGPNSFVEEPGSHVFFADSIPVDYTIFLYLENECGLDTASYTITVLPNTVTAFFNTNVTEGCTPLEVEFTDFSEGGTQIQYNFGDETFTGAANPTHIYNEPGVYTIYQYVDNGCSYDTTQISIEVFASPEIGFDTDVPNLCENETVFFDGDPGTSISVVWDFGDGTGSSLSDPTHTYIAGGTYTVTMTGVNDNECETTISQPFTVFSAPDTDFSIPDQVGCSPFEACFSNASTGGFFYTWDFGDGNTDNGTAACNTYINVGNEAELYTVRLIAQNLQLCADTMELDIIVSPQPVSAFALSSDESCISPADVSTSNFSTDANSFDWYLDGDLVSDELNTDFEFEAVGTYEVTLVASNQFGCTSESEAEFTVHPLPVINFTADPTSGCVPLFVNFTNSSSGGISYLWNFGDGNTSTASNPAHQYDDPGLFDVALIVTTNEGCSDTLETEDMIRAHNLPIASFNTDPEVTNVYDPYFDFMDQSFDAHSWLWNFGDGRLSDNQNVRHYYEEAGNYLVTLTVQNEYGCEDNTTRNVTINDLFDVYVPNTFTPNGDEVNDVFLPRISGQDFMEKYTFTIFDRWGTKVFETNDPNEPWIGDVRNGIHYAKDEAYNWLIRIELKGIDETEEFQGHVIVLR